MGNILLWFQERIKHWTKPSTLPLVSGILSDLTRSRSDLIAENALLRQRKSQGKPKISPETITLIRKMAGENHLWGAERIRGELLKLGLAVSKRTIQKYISKDRKSRASSQTWVLS